MDSKGLKMPVSEAAKVEDSVLGCRFSHKPEHLPIKKRRFLFRTSSPPPNTASSEGTERVEASLDTSSQDVQPKPDASCLPVASLTVAADFCPSGSIGSKLDAEKLVEACKKASEGEDICDISLVAVAAHSNSAGGNADPCEGSEMVSYGTECIEGRDTVKFKANSVKPANMSVEESDLHTPTVLSIDVASSSMNGSSPYKASVDNPTPDESTLENPCSHTPSELECSRVNQVTSKTEKSADRDDRMNWDLNTVMVAWEGQIECDHGISTADVACSNITNAKGKNSCKEGNPEGCEQGRECGSVSENICNEIIPDDLKTLALKMEESEQEECKLDCNDSSKQLHPVICGPPHVSVNKLTSLHDQHVDSSTNGIPVAAPRTIKLEYPVYDISAKHLNVNGRSIDDFSSPMGVGTKFSLGYSLPPGFDHCVNMHALEENVVSSTIVGSGNNVNHGITTVQTHESSIPPGFDHCGRMCASKENVVSSTIVGFGNKVNHAATIKTTESEKLNLSLVSTASLENEVHQGNTFDEDDKALVKRAIASNGIAMENLIGKASESSQDAYTGDCKEANQTTLGSLLVIQSSVMAEAGNPPLAVSSIHDVCSDAEVPIKVEKSPSIAASGMTELTGTMYHISHESHTDLSNDRVSYNKEVCEVPLDNCLGYEKFPSEMQAGSEVDNVYDPSVGYDSQFEDGELRESSIQTWEGYEGEVKENEHGMNDRGTNFHLNTVGPLENGSQCLPESPSGIRSTDIGSQRGADEISSVLLPEKLDSSDQVSGSGPNETENGTREDSMKDSSQSDQWKMYVSGSDLLPEKHIPSGDVTKVRDFNNIELSRIGRYGSETEDLETKAEGSRFYRREPLSRIGGPSTRDGFSNRGRFRMQGCSSINSDESASRSVREPGVMRSFRRGKYTPHGPAGCRGGGTWNPSPGRERDQNHLHSPPYSGPPFRRTLLEDVASVDNLTNEVGVNPTDDGRSVASYVTRQSFRNRLLVNREEVDFRARLGLRPSGDTCYDRFGNRGRGRSLIYGSRHNGGDPRGRFYPSASDDNDDPSMEYSHSFPSRRRCFSPTERRENHPCAHHHSGSTSPPRSRTRSPIGDGFRHRTSRSPNLRSDTSMRRPRSPNYRHGFEADHVEPRNNASPPSSRWVKYKQRSAAFVRRSPPPGRIDPPIAERLNFYDSSRKTKQNENYRCGHPGRFSELDTSGRGYLGNDGDDGYRRGGVVRRYDMGRPVKQFQYDEEAYGPVYDSHDKEALEFHGRGNPKPYNNGTDSNRFRDHPRKPREERENW